MLPIYSGLWSTTPLINDPILVRRFRPGGQGTRDPGCRIEPVPVGRPDTLGFHHPVPSPDKIGTFVIETNPVKIGSPGGTRGGPPFLHFRVAMGTSGAPLPNHPFTLSLIKDQAPIAIQQESGSGRESFPDQL